MGSVVFDFDSTLVPCESLEELCLEVPGLDEAARTAIARITDAGMEGSLSFEDSLRRRLALARPSRPDVEALGARLAAGTTRGAEALIASLHAAGHEVWIVSGGFQDLLEAVGVALGIPPARIHGVRVAWNADGSLGGLRLDDGFARSKLEGVRAAGLAFARPSVGVGDGATDLALHAAGVVDHFVAYTEHARRDPVVRGAAHEAGSMPALGRLLEGLLA
jgi:phosphoserine phosphatase